jgi:two-component system chemotaxis response regulator CheY
MAKTILIVDDSTSMRQVVSIALKGAGHEVIEACDGRDALAKLKGQKINMIVCDVNMPNMDGISFVIAMKEIPAYKFTPVLMLTTESQEDKKNQGKAAGVRAWMVKPFKSDQLLAAVEKLSLP